MVPRQQRLAERYHAPAATTSSRRSALREVPPAPLDGASQKRLPSSPQLVEARPIALDKPAPLQTNPLPNNPLPLAGSKLAPGMSATLPAIVKPADLAGKLPVPLPGPGLVPAKSEFQPLPNQPLPLTESTLAPAKATLPAIVKPAEVAGKLPAPRQTQLPIVMTPAATPVAATGPAPQAITNEFVGGRSGTGTRFGPG